MLPKLSIAGDLSYSGVRTKGHLDIRPPDKRPLRYIITWFRHFNFTFVYHVIFVTFIEQLSDSPVISLWRQNGEMPLWTIITTLSRCWVMAALQKFSSHALQFNKLSRSYINAGSNPPVRTFSLTTMQLSSHGGFAGPSCLIHTCYPNY